MNKLLSVFFFTNLIMAKTSMRKLYGRADDIKINSAAFTSDMDMNNLFTHMWKLFSATFINNNLNCHQG